MAKLFAQEVPEIYDGIIEIKRGRARSRQPRQDRRHLQRQRIDPVGACVGMRGSRVQAVVGELQGEKIDIIPWSPDPATFVVNALAPAEVAKVVMDEEQRRIEVVVPDDQLSLAIGRRGQNVRLASQLTGWDIDILTEDEETERRQEEFRTRSELFIEALDVDDVIAHLLVTEGFTTVEEVAFVATRRAGGHRRLRRESPASCNSARAPSSRRRTPQREAQRQELGVSDEIAALDGITPALAGRVGREGREDARRSRRPCRRRAGARSPTPPPTSSNSNRPTPSS